MKKPFFYLFLFIFIGIAQLLPAQKKYQGLLWEISGNGLAKPSYLYGTMHVSSKLAFHLGDSFFIALNNVDVVALEINPETWVDDMLAYDPYAFWGENMFYNRNQNQNKETQRREAVMEALRSDPSLINYYLYRSQGYTGNFEEDTYLDLYIFQAGKKLKKQVAGLENIGESREMVEKAEKAAQEEYKYKKRKKNNYYDEGRYTSVEEVMEEAYRKGDLDALDSLNNEDGTPGYLEYMLYQRNEMMAKRMDSIIRDKKLPLFAGMGASHLPGDRGVIEILRRMGYNVRSVTRGERDPRQKQKIDEIVIEKKFDTQKSFDAYFAVNLPGKMYELAGIGPTRSYFHPDMANGAYYTVTRIKTFARELNHDLNYVLKSVDSLLYENIPGKIQKQKSITKFGYKGFEISTRTRRGDLQRYEILVTPEEIFIFKLGGTGEFAKNKEADRFFKSILLNIPTQNSWKDFTSPDGTFTALLPHPPLFYGDTSLMGTYYNTEPFTAIDFTNGNVYSIEKTNMFYGASATISDSILLESEIIDFADDKYYDELSRTQKTEGILNITDALYSIDENYHLRVRYLMRHGLLYKLSVKYKNDSADVEKFINSLKFGDVPKVAYTQHNDTLMHFTVTASTEKDVFDKLIRKYDKYKETPKPYRTQRETKAFIENAKSDEVVTVTYLRYGKYIRFKDSATYWQDFVEGVNPDSSFIIIDKKNYTKNGFDIVEIDYTDTGCRFVTKIRKMLRNGVSYELKSFYESNIGIGEYTRTFFETFTPKDTIIGANLFGSNAQILVADLMSSDSATAAEAHEALYNVRVKPENFKLWTTVLDTLQPTNDGYLKYKSQIIEELYDIKTPENIKYLTQLYEKAGDTATFQLSALKTLLNIETKESYAAFKKLILQETPLGDVQEINSLFWGIDSLELATQLYPELLQLFQLDEYKANVIGLLATLVDSNKVTMDIYKANLPVYKMEAKNELKRETADDVENGQGDDDNYYYNGADAPARRYDYSNYSTSTSVYLWDLLTLLMPVYKEKDVKNIFDKVWQLKDNQLMVKLGVKLTQNKLAVPDTLWESLAKKPEMRRDLYDALETAKKLELYPKAYNTQDSMAKAIFMDIASRGSGKPDTIELYKKQIVEIDGEKGYAYLYKYRLEESETWRLAIVGLQPFDTNKLSTENKFYNFGTKIMDEEKSIEKQFALMIKKEKISQGMRQVYNNDYDDMDYSGEDY